jgi:hypothetical protein
MTFLIALLLAFTPAQPIVPIEGGSYYQQAQVHEVLLSQPEFVDLVLAKFPDFEVRIDFGAHAWEGYIDVPIDRTGDTFSETVAHEFSHMIQFASDCDRRWLRELGNLPCDYPWDALATNIEKVYYPEFSEVLPTGRPTVLMLSEEELAGVIFGRDYVEQPQSPEPVIGTSLVWDNGVVYEDGVTVGSE